MTKVGNETIIQQGFERLEELLREQRSLYTRLDLLVAQQREAVRSADVHTLVSASTTEREVVEAIRVIDLRRG